MFKRLIVILTVMVALTFCFTSLNQAQVLMSKRFGIGARVSYLLPRADEIEGAVAYEGSLTYGVSNVFAVELSYGYSRPDLLTPAPNFGEARIRYLNLAFQLRGEPEPDFGLYLQLGPSLYFNGYRASGTDAQDVHADDVFGGHAGFGLDYFINKYLVVNIDIKYLYFDYEYHRDEEGTKDKIDGDSWLVGTGLKFFF